MFHTFYCTHLRHWIYDGNIYRGNYIVKVYSMTSLMIYAPTGCIQFSRTKFHDFSMTFSMTKVIISRTHKYANNLATNMITKVPGWPVSVSFEFLIIPVYSLMQDGYWPNLNLNLIHTYISLPVISEHRRHASFFF